MKKHSIFVALLCSLLFCSALAHAGYHFRYQVTVDHTQAGSSDSSNFPILVYISGNADFKTAGNGGYIQNTTTLNGQTVPADLIVTTDAACQNQVTAWEVASYSGSSGTVELWVNQGTLSHSVNTTFYICIDNSAVTTYQSTAAGVWDSSLQAVWHFAPGSGTLSVNDSTSNGNNLTNTGAVSAVTGLVDGAASGSGSNHLDGPNITAINGTAHLTVSFWVQPTALAGNAGVIGKGTGGGSSQSFFIECTFGADQTLETTFDGGYVHDTSNALANGSWTFETFVYDGTQSTNAGRWINYINGSSVALTFAGTIPSTINSTSANVLLYPSDSTRLNGLLDEFRISTSTRSADWVTAEYNMEKASQTMVTLGSRVALGGPRGAQVAELERGNP
jgi:hypothetical protein